MSFAKEIMTEGMKEIGIILQETVIFDQCFIGITPLEIDRYNWWERDSGRGRMVGISNHGWDLIRKIPKESETKIKIGIVPVNKLISSAGVVTLEEVFKKASRKGLGLCPAKIGLQLVMQHYSLLKELKTINRYFNLYVAMEPILECGSPCIFSIDMFCETVRLTSHCGGSQSSNDYWVFCSV